MKWVARALVALFCLLLLVAGGAGAGYVWFKDQISAPGPLASDDDVTVVIPAGSGVIRVGQQLEQVGLIKDARLFRLAAKYTEQENVIKTGEYQISPASSIVDILNQLEEGKVVLFPVQIIEGSTVAQAMNVIAANEYLTGDLPETPTEGSFLPDTYAFPRGTPRSKVVERLMNEQSKLMAEIWEGRSEDLPVETIDEAIILASVVEKETGGIKDDDLVAGVFVNRLNRGMRLESDPTIIYGISKGERLTKTVNGKQVQRGLYRSEIDRVTPYNTYQIDGLPPTPICNPSEAALRAVLNPAETDYLFFVADGEGGHAFAKTYREHLRNVGKWREIEAAQRRTQRN